MTSRSSHLPLQSCAVLQVLASEGSLRLPDAWALPLAERGLADAAGPVWCVTWKGSREVMAMPLEQRRTPWREGQRLLALWRRSGGSRDTEPDPFGDAEPVIGFFVGVA